MWDDEPLSREQRSALFAEDDRLRAERTEELRQNAEASSLVRANDEAGELAYRNHQNGYKAAPATEADLSELVYERIADCMATVVVELRREWRAQIADEVRRLAYTVARNAVPGEQAEREVHELAVRVLHLEQQVRKLRNELAGDGDAVELPRGFLRRVA
jgi:hypothetical protein